MEVMIKLNEAILILKLRCSSKVLLKNFLLNNFSFLDSDDDANTNEINSSKIRLRKPFSIENNKQKQINQYQTIHETIIEPPSPPAHIIKEILTPKSSIKLSKNSFSKSQNKKNQEMNDLLIKTNSNDLNKKQSNDILPIIDEEKR